jgi:hypothetical protein
LINAHTTSQEAIGQAIEAVETPQPEELSDFPQAVVDWLARLRLLEGVPFSYLVPHADMLPLESIRFFYLNRNWLDAAVDGALSLGAASTRDRLHLETLYVELRKALDEAERKVWATRTGGEPQQGDAEVVTGLLLRSRAVAGWPGLHVSAERAGDPPEAMRLLRVERLAPAVLLALIDGVPDTVHVEEPKSAVQFGVDPDDGGRSLRVRDPATGKPKDSRKVSVPFRAGAPGVIDMTALRDKLTSEAGDVVGPTLSSAELALQLLQYPYREIFTETEAPMSDVFQPTVPMSQVRESHGG